MHMYMYLACFEWESHLFFTTGFPLTFILPSNSLPPSLPPSLPLSLSPSKNDFIIAKYKHLQMLPRLSQKDNPNALSELSKVGMSLIISTAL